MKKKLLPFYLMIYLTSCNPDKVFEEYRKFDNLSWNRFDIVTFSSNIIDVTVPYDILLNIRHLPEFQNKDLRINFTIELASGEIRTAEHNLVFRQKNGESLSSCLGDMCDISILLRENYYFSEAGTIKFEIENKWTKLELPGVIEVGLVIRKAGN